MYPGTWQGAGGAQMQWGRNSALLQISSQNESAGRAAVLALKGSSVSNRQQLSLPIANS